MTGDPTKFLSIKRKKKGKVTFGYNLSSKIIGKGIVAIRDKMKYENVLLIKNLKPNLLSEIQTFDQGHICIFDSEKCEIRRNDSGKLLHLEISHCLSTFMRISHFLSTSLKAWLESPWSLFSHT